MHTNPQVLFEVDVFHQLYHSFLHSSILLRQSQFDPPFCRTKPHLKASRTLKRDPGRADRTGPVETTRLWSWVPVTGRLSEGGGFLDPTGRAPFGGSFFSGYERTKHLKMFAGKMF